MVTPTDGAAKLKKRIFEIAAGCVALLSFFGGYHYWQVRSEAQRLAGEVAAGPLVDVARPRKSPSERELSLVGEARPYASVTLYAKVSGYLKQIPVDKGDVVKKDQVLAIIESPEIDKDYQGVLADARNKKTIAARMQALRDHELVSPQEADQATSDAQVSDSRLQAAAAQKGYEVLRAPFDGTVTIRYADPGALVQNATNSQTSALPVVTVSQVDRLRVYVYIDQRDAAYVKVGMPAQVQLQERPDLNFKATVSRVSGELDPKTKMLLSEIDLENKEGQVVPGSFVRVNLQVHMPESLQIPVQGLLIRQGNPVVPIIDDKDLIHFRSVQVGDNDGQWVAVRSGLADGERVALNISTDLADGTHVRPKPSPAAPAGEKSK